MAVAVDTNVIIDVVAGTPDVTQRAVRTLSQEGSRTALIISPVVYCELFAHRGWTKTDIDKFLQSTAIGVDWQLSLHVWEAAGAAFSAYAQRRQRHAGFPRLLTDFVVGAHALEAGGLITGDRDFYATNFPKLRLVGLAD